jgi:hypothetical protein
LNIFLDKTPVRSSPSAEREKRLIVADKMGVFFPDRINRTGQCTSTSGPSPGR